MGTLVKYLYTFDLGGRKGSDGEMSPSSIAEDAEIIRPGGQWGVYRIDASILYGVYVDGPITNGVVSTSIGGDGYGGWKSVNIGLAVPSSLWDVLGGYEVPLPTDAMGYVGVEFGSGLELASNLVSVTSRLDYLTKRWLFSISFLSGTGEYGPGLSNEVFAAARFHFAVTGVNEPEPEPEPVYFWMNLVNAKEIV